MGLYSTVRIYHNLCSYFPNDKHFHHFQFFDSKNNATIKHPSTYILLYCHFYFCEPDSPKWDLQDQQTYTFVF